MSCSKWNKRILDSLSPPQALSQHVSQFRGARRTGVHFLRKNKWAPDRPLLYLRGKRAKYISSAF